MALFIFIVIIVASHFVDARSVSKCLNHASERILGLAAFSDRDVIVIVINGAFGYRLGFGFGFVFGEGGSSASCTSRIGIGSGFEGGHFFFPLLREFVTKLNLSLFTGSVEVKDTVFTIRKMWAATVVTLRETKLHFPGLAYVAEAIVLPVVVKAHTFGAAHNVG